MALYIAPQQQPQISGLDLLGQGLGSSIGSGLQELADAKIKDLFRRKEQSDLADSLRAMGLPSEQAQQLSKADPNLLKDYLKNIQQQKTYASLGAGLQSLYGGGQQFTPASTEDGPQVEAGMPQQPTGNIFENMSGSDLQARLLASGLDPKVTDSIVSTFNADRKALREKEASEQKKTAAAFKETKVERKQIIDSYKSARDDLRDLDRLEELQVEGQLDTPGYIQFLERSGLDFPAMMNPESQEFQKISQNFMRNVKEYFGSRINRFEVEQFLKTIPTLSQSPEGRKRIISNLKQIARSKKEYFDAYKDVMKENKNVPPFDLGEQVEEKVDKRLDKIAEQFRKDLKKEVPKGQRSYIAGLQAAFGSLIGAPGALISAIGSRIGGK